jgi:hypothetical protein
MWAMMQKLRMFFIGQNSGVLASQRMVHGTECTGKGTPGNSAVGLSYLYARPPATFKA